MILSLPNHSSLPLSTLLTLECGAAAYLGGSVETYGHGSVDKAILGIVNA
jgi:hypothetical protein